MKILYLIIFITLFVSCTNNSNNPINYPYLTVHRATDDLQVYDGKWHRQLFGKGVIIECALVNKSNSVNYKDIKLMVKYYSITHTVMASYNYIIYQYLNSGKLLKVKLNGPKTDLKSLGTVSVDVADATQY